MILDANTILSDAQAVTATAASTSYYDQAAAGDALGRPLYVEFLIDTTFTPNSATIVFELECDDNTSFSSAKTLLRTGAIADTVLVAGYRVLRARIPAGTERYIQARYTVSGTAVAGKIDCRFVESIDFLITSST